MERLFRFLYVKLLFLTYASLEKKQGIWDFRVIKFPTWPGQRDDNPFLCMTFFTFIRLWRQKDGIDLHSLLKGRGGSGFSPRSFLLQYHCIEAEGTISQHAFTDVIIPGHNALLAKKTFPRSQSQALSMCGVLREHACKTQENHHLILYTVFCSMRMLCVRVRSNTLKKSLFPIAGDVRLICRKTLLPSQELEERTELMRQRR